MSTDKLFISSKTSNQFPGNNPYDTVDDPVLYSGMEEHDEWRSMLSNSWKFTNPLEIDGYHWATLQHYIDANKYDIDSDVYYNFTLESKSEMSQDPTFSQQFIQQTQSRGPKQEEFSRTENIYWQPRDWNKIQQNVLMKGYYHKFINPELVNEYIEYSDYQDILRLTNDALLFKRKSTEGSDPSMETLMLTRTKLEDGYLEFDENVHLPRSQFIVEESTDATPTNKGLTKVTSEIIRKTKLTKRIQSQREENFRKIKRHELQMIQERGYDLETAVVYNFDTPEDVDDLEGFRENLHRLTSVKITKDEFVDFSEEHNVFTNRLNMSTLYTREEQTILVLYILNEQHEPVSIETIDNIENIYNQDNTINRFIVIVKNKISDKDKTKKKPINITKEAESKLLSIQEKNPIEIEIIINSVVNLNIDKFEKLQIIKDRGFDISYTKESIFDQSEKFNISTLYIEPERSILVLYLPNKKGKQVSLDTISVIQEIHKQDNDIKHFIAIVQSEISPKGKDKLIIIQKENPIKIEIFEDNYFMFNPTRHGFSAIKTEIFKRGKEVNEFLTKEKLNYDLNKLPRITTVDPIKRYHNVPRGSLINSTRISIIDPQYTDTFTRRVDVVPPKLQEKKVRSII